jgi:hypothetical protein
MKLEDILERAPELAQDRLNHWNSVCQSGGSLTAKGAFVLGKTFEYWDRKRRAESWRACQVAGEGIDQLKAEAETQEKDAKLAFALAYLEFDSSRLASN